MRVISSRCFWNVDSWVVAITLESGQEVWLTHGDLFEMAREHSWIIKHKIAEGNK